MKKAPLGRTQRGVELHRTADLTACLFEDRTPLRLAELPERGIDASTRP
ncbi:hypothetical protein [Streptomyces sp. NPDC018610]